MNIVVIGAGIGGLTSALALSRAGHHVVLVEQRSDFAAAGAGIVLAPNAVHALASLGVSLKGEGAVVAGSEVRRADGRLLNELAVGRLAADHGPTYGIARARVHALLEEALPDDVEMLLGQPVESIDEHPHEVVVRTSQGALQADLVVAADGLHSTVRTQVIDPESGPSLRYSGNTCWRGFADLAAGGTLTEAWGGRTRVGVVPVDGVSSYYYLVRSSPAGTSQDTQLADLRADFDGFAGVAGELISGLVEMPPLHHDLFELERPVWGTRRVLLLGDAAHAMTPNQGQGAAMAIEDALAVTMAVEPGVDGALDRYVAIRDRRVRKVQLGSRRFGAMAHWTSPAAMQVRNAVLQTAPPAAGDRALRSLVGPGLELVQAPRRSSLT